MSHFLIAREDSIILEPDVPGTHPCVANSANRVSKDGTFPIGYSVISSLEIIS